MPNGAIGMVNSSAGKGIATAMTRSEFVRTLEETFGVPPGGLQPSDTRASVGGWSSLTDVTILTILFSEFGLEAEDELLDYRSIGDLLAILDRHRVFADS
jgi:acyl carrier protein